MFFADDSTTATDDLQAGQSDTPSPEGATQEPTLEEKYAELYDQYVRMAADFDNYRKRNAQEQLSWRKYAAEGTISAMLPVLDNLDRASASLTEQSEPKLLLQSLRMMATQLMSTLETIGVKRMKTLGEKFDPMQHDAIGQEPANHVQEGTILNEELAGYLLHDRVIRPASVKVSVKAEDTSAESDTLMSNPFKTA
ncbi:MAG: nucleotide exchange factor GrpE [Vampirovibrionales bacterium]|nr:nucleotide exchange factor GrpE [Vampirovibrionales bacterium]